MKKGLGPAMPLNYRSHIGEQTPAKYVGLFSKMPTSLVGHNADIVYPADATTLHYEAEVCLVIGKRAKGITEAQVKDHVFGVTPCNDVSERAWQKADLQWFRAKGSRHVRTDGTGAGPWCRLQQAEPDRPPERPGRAGILDRDAVLPDRPDRQLRQPLRHARGRRRDFHRHPRHTTQAMKPGDTY